MNSEINSLLKKVIKGDEVKVKKIQAQALPP